MSDTDHLATMTTKEYEELLRKVDDGKVVGVLAHDQRQVELVLDYLEMARDAIRTQAKELRATAKTLEERVVSLENEGDSLSDSIGFLRRLGNWDPRDAGREAVRIAADELGVRLP